jgi:ABC-type polysaccharide/polyol phosphate export permease
MGIENYPLYLIPGYLAWNFTFNAIINSSESILQSKYLITKIAFPNEIIILASIAVSFVDFTLSLLLFLIGAFIFSNIITLPLILVPLIIIIQILFTIGFSLIVATGSVYFKDIPKLIPILGNIFFFLTPIFYPLNFIPETLRSIVLINPLALIVMLFHDTMYYQKVPDPEIFTIAALISTLVFLAGFIVFNKFKYSFAELS